MKSGMPNMTQAILFQQVLLNILKIFPQYSELIEAWFSRWEEMLGDPLEEVVEVLSALKSSGISLYTSSVTGQQKLIQLRKRDSISCTGLTEKSFPAKPE